VVNPYNRALSYDRVDFSSPPSDTKSSINQTPINRASQPFWETLGKLKLIGKLLQRLQLLNSKYLLKRDDTYYISLKLSAKTTYKKSLHTNNFVYANIIKLKIINHLKIVDENLPFVKVLYPLTDADKKILLSSSNNDEENFIRKIVIEISQKLSMGKKISTTSFRATPPTKNKIQTLEKSCEHFINFKSKVVSSKVIMKYNQAINYLYVYFTHTIDVKNIDIKDANDFRLFLLEVPLRWKTQPLLKGKNIKTLIQRKSNLLDSLPKQEIRTTDEVIVKCKTIFDYFRDNTFVETNPFMNMKKMNKNSSRKWREFSDTELKKVIRYMMLHKQIEEYNFFKFGLYTGLRRGEILNIKIKNVDLEKTMIDIYGTKNDNAKRIMVIHKDLVSTLEEQIKDKDEQDYLFFNYQDLVFKYRDEKIGKLINDIIKYATNDECKNEINIHSLRKNFSQILFFSNQFTDLQLKTLVGHSTASDTTDSHYLRGKRDYKLLKSKMDNVDFSHYFI